MKVKCNYISRGVQKVKVDIPIDIVSPRTKRDGGGNLNTVTWTHTQCKYINVIDTCYGNF